MRKTVFLALSVLLVVSCVGAALAAEEVAPKYMTMEVQILGGPTAVFQDLLAKNEHTLLVFYQAACSACRGELTLLRDKYADRKNLKILGVSVDVRPELASKFKSDWKLPFEVLSDPDYKIPSVFNISATPACVLLEKDGKIAKKFFGYDSSFEGQLEAALK